MKKENFDVILSPRITALIVSKNTEGKINAAPFSFVYPLSFNPPLVGIGIGKGKITLKNIQETKEFTVNIVSVDFAQKAVNCEEKIEFHKRIEKNNLHLEESKKIKVPRIKESKAVLECILTEVIEVKESDHLIAVGKVVEIKAEEKNGLPDMEKMNYLMHENGNVFRTVGKKVLLERKR
jgi:flavin reductase (DIM6/NTAB) family NADH-FMN oxidoreductase RutF